MTLILRLQPEEEARLCAVARAKGLCPEDMVRAALEKFLSNEAGISDTPVSGAALVAAMQSSPYKNLDLESSRARLPVRSDVLSDF